MPANRPWRRSFCRAYELAAYYNEEASALIQREDRPTFQDLLNLPFAGSKEWGGYGGCGFGKGPEEDFLYAGSGTNLHGGMNSRSQSHLEPHAVEEEPGNRLRRYLHGGHGRGYKAIEFFSIPGSQAVEKGSDVQHHLRFLTIFGEEVVHHKLKTWEPVAPALPGPGNTPPSGLVAAPAPPGPAHLPLSGQVANPFSEPVAPSRLPYRNLSLPGLALWEDPPWKGLNTHARAPLGWGFSLGRIGEILTMVRERQAEDSRREEAAKDVLDGEKEARG
ncbi:hypothetical protein IMZ48_38615 [Candidatus Bathyarchaeota archaeon]|nr:hypothetical protein [Candidatus Bathyarchaeota archaeon]